MDYRHIIDWLVRKPGAFENYRYRDELFPISRFRMAFDALEEQHGRRGSKEYLRILELAAKQSESKVDGALRTLLQQSDDSIQHPISADAVEARLTGANDCILIGHDKKAYRCRFPWAFIVNAAAKPMWEVIRKCCP